MTHTPLTPNTIDSQLALAVKLAEHDTALNSAETSITALQAGADSMELVYRPNSSVAAAGNVFTSWSALMTARALIEGVKHVEIDQSIASGTGGVISNVSTAFTLTKLTSVFTSAMVGRTIEISGSSNPFNNGSFTITAQAGTTITYTNATAGAAADASYAGPWIVMGLTTRIPGTGEGMPLGGWDMNHAELLGFATGRGTFQAVQWGAGIGGGAGDVQFANLGKIGGDLNVTSLNTVLPVIDARSCALFELGTGDAGDFPNLTNTGPAPFFDLQNANMQIRCAGSMTGTVRVIELGNSAGTFTLALHDQARLQSGSLAGTNPAAVLMTQGINISGQIGRQAAFAGTIRYNSSGAGFPRGRMFPYALNQAPIAPSTTAATFITGSGGAGGGGAAFNTTVQLDAAAGVITQTLPLIRVATSQNQNDNNEGVVESTGLTFSVKETSGINGVILTPSANPVSVSGTGDSFVAAVTSTGDSLAVSAGVVTLTDASALFTVGMTGQSIRIAGATSIANNGTFVMTYVSATVVTFPNTAGVTEAYTGTWTVDAVLTDSAGVFLTTMVNRAIRISSATTAANNGAFIISARPSTTTLQYRNAAAVTEAYTGTWIIGDTIMGAVSYTMPAGSAATLQSDGVSNWVVLTTASDLFTPPERWHQTDVAATQTAVALTTTSAVFTTDFKMMRSGSVVGLSTRLNATVTAGTLTVVITKNGTAGTLAVVSTSSSNTTGGQKTQNSGIDTYVAGDLLGMKITTNSGLLPDGSADLEAWLQVQE